jgi:plasmid stabilization system protein ParE
MDLIDRQEAVAAAPREVRQIVRQLEDRVEDLTAERNRAWAHVDYLMREYDLGGIVGLHNAVHVIRAERGVS